jgi:hypothetical protein
MTVEELRLALADPMTPDRFRQLRADLATWDPSELFETLLRFALDTEPSNSDVWASALLVELEPPCPISCEEALRRIARSRMNHSNRLIPFYLAAQFGKRRVLRIVRRLRSVEFEVRLPERLKVVRYWLRVPSISLPGWFSEWRRR